MSDLHTGHCLCGAVSYEFEGDPAMVAMCHCEDCQRSSGAAFSVNVAIDLDQLKITGRESMTTYNTVGQENGETRDRNFCAKCGTPLFSVLHEANDMAFLKAGTLDDKTWFAPELEVWTDSAQTWFHAADNDERGLFPAGIPS